MNAETKLAVINAIRKRRLLSFLFSLYWCRRMNIPPDVGWLRSFRERSSIDGKGNPIPWLTYPLVRLLEERVNKQMSVFEYGSGNSTLWWAEHAAHVIACEHDKYWHDKLTAVLPSNAELLYFDFVPEGDYSKAITQYDRAFHIVIIDGIDRVNCGLNILNSLKEDGVVIWDNTDTDQHRVGINYLLDSGFKRRDFRGNCPIETRLSCTSILYKPLNCLGL